MKVVLVVDSKLTKKNGAHMVSKCIELPFIPEKSSKISIGSELFKITNIEVQLGDYGTVTVIYLDFLKTPKNAKSCKLKFEILTECCNFVEAGPGTIKTLSSPMYYISEQKK